MPIECRSASINGETGGTTNYSLGRLSRRFGRSRKAFRISRFYEALPDTVYQYLNISTLANTIPFDQIDGGPYRLEWGRGFNLQALGINVRVMNT